MTLFWRPLARRVLDRLEEPAHLLQILIGPRQVGKTTAIGQIVEILRRKGFEIFSASADALAAPRWEWIEEHWRKAAATAKSGKPTALVFDELQKIPGWSEIVKKEFDALQKLKPALRPRILISGSSALLVEKGLTESLAGRFELIRFPHWSLGEESDAFHVGLDRYIALGGYPRLRAFAADDRFLEYVRDSVIESVLGKDLLLLHPVEKPVLLRRVFEFACHHPAEIVSLQKMLGQLSDRGNAATIASYLDLLSQTFLVAPLQKYSPEILRIRSSSPKLIVPAQALIAAAQRKTPSDLIRDRELYGRWAENAVGAHLLRGGLEVFYWRERDEEIDFIARQGDETLAVEVGVARKKNAAAALERLARKRGISRALLVGPDGVDLAEFLRSDPVAWLRGKP